MFHGRGPMHHFEARKIFADRKHHPRIRGAPRSPTEMRNRWLSLWSSQSKPRGTQFGRRALPERQLASVATRHHSDGPALQTNNCRSASRCDDQRFSREEAKHRSPRPCPPDILMCQVDHVFNDVRSRIDSVGRSSQISRAQQSRTSTDTLRTVYLGGLAPGTPELPQKHRLSFENGSNQ